MIRTVDSRRAAANVRASAQRGEPLVARIPGASSTVVKSLTDGAGATSSKSTVADDLRFDDATGKLKSESSAATTRLAKVLTAFGKVKLKIEGHTDNMGDPGDNKKKSLERATAVKDALVEAGVPADRITVEGAGQEHPIAANDTEEGRAANRRIELSIVSK